MTAKEDPELISFYGHMESTSTYRAIPPEELRADWKSFAQQIKEGPHRDR